MAGFSKRGELLKPSKLFGLKCLNLIIVEVTA